MPAALPRALSGSGLAGALNLLTPPFAAAATHESVALVDGVLRISGPRQNPAVLVRLRPSLARTAVVVRAQVGGEDLQPVVFGGFSSSGCALPLYAPAAAMPDAEVGATGSFELTVRVWHLDGPDAAGVAHDVAAVLALADAAGAPVADERAGELVEAVVLEGTLARLVFLSTLEKQRVEAVSREVSAGRHVSLGRAASLDARGKDLSVPRLAAEDDDAYRARLSIYSSWRLATPTGFAAALNGPGAADEPNTGLPSLVGVTSRFRIVDQAEQLAVSMRLIEVGDDGGSPTRDRLADLLTSGLLIDLRRLPPKYLPSGTRERLTQVRATLLDAFTLTAGPDQPRYLSALTASSLALAIRLLALLTGDPNLDLQRAWTREPDGRHELGQGVQLARLNETRLDAARDGVQRAQAALAAGDVVALPGGSGDDIDSDLLTIIAGVVPRTVADDPLARWLFGAAGMATITAPAEGSVYLSPLPSLGLVIDGPATLARGESASYVARMRPSDASGRHILVDEAWHRAQPTVETIGAVGDPMTPADLGDLLRELADLSLAATSALAPLVGVGLTPASPSEFAARVLEAYDLDLLLAVKLDEPIDAIDSDSAAARQLRERVVARSDALTANGFHSVRVITSPDGSTLLLLGALSVLPGGSNRPGQPPPAAYRWYVTELPTPTPEPTPMALRRATGGSALLTGRRPGLALLVCVAYARRGLADPYEVRIELDDDSVMSLEQYGYVMNLLEHLCPLGIEINTFDLRRSHVSIEGAPPRFLSSRVSRSYTRFVRRRPTAGDRYPEASES